jgi:hypothetical protein
MERAMLCYLLLTFRTHWNTWRLNQVLLEVAKDKINESFYSLYLTAGK